MLRENLLSSGSQEWIFCFFAAAFLVKMPAFPIHGWMPDAYRAAPLPVLILLSAVLSKVGAYGFLRVALPLFPDATVQFQEVVMLIALASILYGSVMAFTQTNVRLIAGYSSVAQLGFITLGIFSLRADGADGAVLQMVNHGLVVARDVPRHRDRLRAHEDRGPAPRWAAWRCARRCSRRSSWSSRWRTWRCRARPTSSASSTSSTASSSRRSRSPSSPSIGIALAAFYAPADVPAVDAQPPARGHRVARDLGCATASCSRRWSRCIVALALYPGLILERGEDVGDDAKRRRGGAGEPRDPALVAER